MRICFEIKHLNLVNAQTCAKDQTDHIYVNKQSQSAKLVDGGKQQDIYIYISIYPSRQTTSKSDL